MSARSPYRAPPRRDIASADEAIMADIARSIQKVKDADSTPGPPLRVEREALTRDMNLNIIFTL